jgi:intracellular septation protein
VSNEQASPSPGLRLVIDYLPLAIFFAVNFLLPSGTAMRIVAASTGALSDMERAGALVVARVLVATVAFVIATVGVMILSKARTGRISPMLWLSGGLVVVFGGFTLYFHDQRFIQMKPTIVYAALAAVLVFGLLTGRPLLQGLLESAYPGLNPDGWRKLTRNWAFFFAAMAVLNEAVWRSTSWDFWVGYKLWGAMPLTLLFAFANLPMLMRHGLQVEEPVPPPQ